MEAHCIHGTHNSLSILGIIYRCRKNWLRQVNLENLDTSNLQVLCMVTHTKPTLDVWLTARGWSNQQYSIYPLRRTTRESVIHLFAHHRHSQRIWEVIHSWCTVQWWHNIDSMLKWWHMVRMPVFSCKAVRPLTLLVTSKLWGKPTRLSIFVVVSSMSISFLYFGSFLFSINIFFLAEPQKYSQSFQKKKCSFVCNHATLIIYSAYM